MGNFEIVKEKLKILRDLMLIRCEWYKMVLKIEIFWY